MTNDFDELASAYMDGQATPDEVARVEADPELLSRAGALGAMAAELGSIGAPTDPTVRDRHLGAALAAFDELFPATGGDTDGSETGDSSAPDPGGPALVEVQGARIIHLPGEGATVDTARRVHATPERAGPPAAGRRRRRRAGGVPTWLGAAAASLAVLGGVALFARDGNDSGDETAAIAVDDAATEEDDAGASEPSAAASARSGEAAEGGGAELSIEATDDAELADEEADDGDATETAGGEERTEAAESTTTGEAEGGVLRFTSVPDQGELAQRRAGAELSAPTESDCAAALPPPAGTELVGYIEALVGDVAGEALVYAPPGGGSEVIVLVDGGCEPF